MRPSRALAGRQRPARSASCATGFATVSVRHGAVVPDQGICRFATAAASTAGPRSKVAVGEMLRAITLTVLLVQAAASSSTKRVDEATAACAKSPAGSR
jgi:hypothetical protein